MKSFEDWYSETNSACSEAIELAAIRAIKHELKDSFDQIDGQFEAINEDDGRVSDIANAVIKVLVNQYGYEIAKSAWRNAQKEVADEILSQSGLTGFVGIR